MDAGDGLVGALPGGLDRGPERDHGQDAPSGSDQPTVVVEAGTGMQDVNTGKSLGLLDSGDEAGSEVSRASGFSGFGGGGFGGGSGGGFGGGGFDGGGAGGSW